MKNVKVGLARSIITPPVGTVLSGYACRPEPSTGVLDELYARAIVLDNGSTRVAMVVCDLIWVPKEIVRRSRIRIREICGIDESNVMISGIHTHTGPDLQHGLPAYQECVVEKICGTVFAALDRMTEARIGYAQGSCLAGANRRNPKAPRGAYHLYTNPDGAFDPTVAVLKIDDLSGKEMGVLFNYACHPVCLGWAELNISKDFLHFTHSMLEREAANDDYVSIFLQGCCGNVNPRWQWDRPDLSPAPEAIWPKEFSGRLAETRRIGQILGAEVLKVLASITHYETTPNLGASSCTVTLPVREDLPDQMQKVVADKIKDSPASAGQQGNAYQQVAAGKKEFTTEVQVLRIGNCIVIGLPGEQFIEYQMELRKKIKSPLLLVSELANDEIFYVPTAQAYQQGGYEVTFSLLPPQGGQRLVDSAVAQAENLMKR